MVTGWRHTWSRRVHHIHPLQLLSHIAGQWDVPKDRKTTLTLQNHACIRQLVQELIKWYFQASAGDTYWYLLFTNQGLVNIAHSVLQVCQFILVYTKKFYPSNTFMYIFFSLAQHYFSAVCPWCSLFFYYTPQELICFVECFSHQLSVLDFHCFFNNTPQELFCFVECFSH